VSENMRRNTDAALAVLERQGADMADPVSQKDQLTSYGRHFAELVATSMGQEQARHAAQVSADLDPFGDPKLQVDGVEVDAFAGWALTPIWNLLNWNPVLAAPRGLDPQNMTIQTSATVSSASPAAEPQR
jgi:hypothetical protein